MFTGLVSLPSISETGKSAEGRFYRPELDALRFFAFFSVFMSHALNPDSARNAPTPTTLMSAERIVGDAGGFGLCLFFLLSSYLITELLLREETRTGTVHLRAFYVRRILRIWPLYFAMVGFGYFFGLIRPGSPWGLGRLIAYLLLAGNLYTARHGQTQNPAGALWSISVEEQFYLLWPSIAKRGERWLMFVSAMLIPLSYFWLFVLFRKGTSLEQGIRTNSIVQFQFFGIGALIALRLQGTAPSIRSPARIVMLLSGVGLWLLASGYFKLFGSAESIPLWRVLMGYGSVAMGCGLLCLGTLGAPSSWFPKELVFLGKISYGLYVFHLLGIRFSYAFVARLHHSPKIASALLTLHIPLALVFTGAMAFVSYRFFETPFLRMKERFTFVKSRGI